jgi:hypothetical protein
MRDQADHASPAWVHGAKQRWQGPLPGSAGGALWRRLAAGWVVGRAPAVGCEARAAAGGGRWRRGPPHTGAGALLGLVPLSGSSRAETFQRTSGGKKQPRFMMHRRKHKGGQHWVIRKRWRTAAGWGRAWASHKAGREHPKTHWVGHASGAGGRLRQTGGQNAASNRDAAAADARDRENQGWAQHCAGAQQGLRTAPSAPRGSGMRPGTGTQQLRVQGARD